METEQAIRSLRKRAQIPQQISGDNVISLSQLLRDAAVRAPQQLAFTSLGCTLNYRQIDRLSDDFAVYLQQHSGLIPGDRIAIQLPNLIQYPVAFYGALKAGLVVVNVNPLYTERELRHQFNDAGAKALVVLANVADTVAAVLPSTAIERVIVTELGDLHGALRRTLINFAARYIKRMVPRVEIEAAVSLRSCLALGRCGKLRPVPVCGQDIALLQYTGGTTGLAKGAMLSHKNILANVAQAEVMFKTFEAFDTLSKKTVVLPLPLYHIYASMLCSLMVKLNCHCLLIPNPRDLSSMVKAMRGWKFGCFCGLNTLFVALSTRKDFAALDFSSLAMTISGGMALTSDAAGAWKAVTGSDIYEGYGLTESSPVISINVASPLGLGRKLGSIGVLLPSTELRIVDEGGAVLPCGEIGELQVRGPQVMEGYWNLEEKTAQVLDSEGWLATGDIACVDEQGFPSIVDRKKDMIIVSGFNVYPNEVEEVLTQHAQVRECAVIGVDDVRAGEKVVAFIVRDGDVSASALIAWSRGQLAGYKVPSEVEFVDDLPKSNVGKVLRRELRELVVEEG